MNPPVDAWIGLGSNLDGPVIRVRQALADLDSLARTRVTARSSLYRSAPMGPAGQPDYVNAVARLSTRLDPHELLDELQRLERAAGRVRDGERWGPRTLDLDLLLHADRTIDDDRLRLPHPGIAERPFVLVPLAELAAGLEIPGHGRVADLVEMVDRTAVACLRDVTA